MAIEIREVFSWQKDGCSSVAVTQVGDWAARGYEKRSMGFRVFRNGQPVWGGSLPFKSIDAAQAKVDFYFNERA